MGWIAIAVVLILVAFVLATVSWKPLRAVSREKFGHWIESLMRYYEDAATLSISSPSTSVQFQFRRTRSKGDGCELILEIPGCSLAWEHRGELLDEIRRRGYEPIVAPGGEGATDDSSIVIEIEVPNIWNHGAGNRGARLVHTALDVMGVDLGEEFNLSFEGLRSRARTLEARKRLNSDTFVG